jgi:hypothetical protein
MKIVANGYHAGTNFVKVPAILEILLSSEPTAEEQKRSQHAQELFLSVILHFEDDPLTAFAAAADECAWAAAAIAGA